MILEQPESSSLGSDRQSTSGAASAADLIELLREHIVGERLEGTAPGQIRTDGVIVASNSNLTRDADGKVVIALGAEAEKTWELQAAASEAGVALLLLESHEGSSAKGEGFASRDNSAEIAGVPTLWLDEHVDWVEIIAICRAATLGGTADTAVGIPLGDVFALANSMATMAGGAVSIVDTVGRILGYSTVPDQDIDDLRRRTTLTLQEDESPEQDSEFAELYAAGRAVTFPPYNSSSFPRVGIAVRSSGEVLGTIWVILGARTNPGTVIEILEMMEPIVSQHLLSARFFGRREIERTTDLIRSVIQDPDTAAVSARFLGLSLHGHRVVVRFRFLASRNGSTVRDLHRLHHSVEMHARMSFARAVTALIDTDVIAIIEVDDSEAHDQVVQFSRRIVDYHDQSGTRPLNIGIGGITGDLKGLEKSNLQSLDTLAIMERAGRDRSSEVGSFSDWRSAISISYIAESMHSTHLWTQDYAQAVLEYDAENSTAFAETLLGFFRSRENIAATASLLHTHHNTIRYRLSRAEKLFHLDLNDSSQRLWLWLRLEAEEQKPAYD